MTIGEQLKKTRSLFGLTQKQMCGGIISESFYSKVERNQNEISAVDLLKILNLHHISLYDFFKVFDEEKFADDINVNKYIIAFGNHDIKQLNQYLQLVPENSKTALRIRLMIGALENKVEELPVALRQKMRCNILQIGCLDRTTLWDLAYVMPLYDFNEISVLIDLVFDNYDKININDQQALLALANVEINYLARCFQEKKIKAGRKIIEHLASLPSTSTIFIFKLLAKYYDFAFKQDFINANKILSILHKSGYKAYLQTFNLNVGV